MTVDKLVPQESDTNIMGFPHGCGGTELGLGQSLDLKVYS